MPASGVEEPVKDGGTGLPDDGDGDGSRLTQEWVSAQVRTDLGLFMRAAH